MVPIDWTISIGTIIQTFLIISAIIGGLWKLYDRIGKIESRVETMWLEFVGRVLRDKNDSHNS